MVFQIKKKFHWNFNLSDKSNFVTKNTFEKEDLLKQHVKKILEKKDLSDFDSLNSLFSELKEELKNMEKDQI